MKPACFVQMVSCCFGIEEGATFCNDCKSSIWFSALKNIRPFCITYFLQPIKMLISLNPAVFCKLVQWVLESYRRRRASVRDDDPSSGSKLADKTS